MLLTEATHTLWLSGLTHLITPGEGRSGDRGVWSVKERGQGGREGGREGGDRPGNREINGPGGREEPSLENRGSRNK